MYKKRIIGYNVMVNCCTSITRQLLSIFKFQILRHIAVSSPECQLVPGEPLDVPHQSVDDVTSSLEEQVKVTSANHEQTEIGAQAEHKTDFR